MQFKAVCFDLDGTFLNSLTDIGYCTNKILLSRGLPSHNLKKIRGFLGSGLRHLVTSSLPQEYRYEKIIQEFIKDFEKTYRNNLFKNTTPYKGIPELLYELRRKKIKLTILSNKPQKFTSLSVKRLLPNWEFESVIGLRDGFPKKPDTRGFALIKKKLQLKSKEFLFVGDTEIDIKTAIKANCFPVGVLWGFSSKKTLKDNGARAIIKKPLELLDIIK